jgi:hypothetical protein
MNATERLAASEAGRVVLTAIDAHGGLANWYAAGPLAFQFRYEGTGRPAVDTDQTIDTWRSRAVHRVTGSTNDAQFGWDGRRAWTLSVGDDMPTNPRFWSLTPYYFVAMPFVLADPGVELELLEPEVLQGSSHDVVRVTFAEGTGDAPDDFYLLYFDQNTHLVGGLRYVVSYPGFFPDGGHSPEKIMEYSAPTTVDGITFATDYRSWMWVDGTRADESAHAVMSNIRFLPWATGQFDPPEDATILDGY